jgi:hypothetical protein
MIKKYYLLLAFFLISVIALLYGVSPHWFARTFLGVAELDPNFSHILRAVMCLYLAFGLFWLFSAFSDRYRDTAVLTTIIFGGGLVIGRILSLFADGRPSPILVLYVILELAIIPVAFWIFRLPDAADTSTPR